MVGFACVSGGLPMGDFECRGFRDKKNKARLYQQPWNR
jgi:hypothetical protein